MSILNAHPQGEVLSCNPAAALACASFCLAYRSASAVTAFSFTCRQQISNILAHMTLIDDAMRTHCFQKVQHHDETHSAACSWCSMQFTGDN